MKMLIIGITGGTGCGKTTVVNQIIKELSGEEVTVISQDSYYKDLSHLSFEERTKNNFDHPNSIDFELLKEHLLKLKAGETIQSPTYSFVEHNRTKETVLVKPTKVVIVEGILIFSHPDIRSLFDIKIFVHADSDERLIRRILIFHYIHHHQRHDCRNGCCGCSRHSPSCADLLETPQAGHHAMDQPDFDCLFWRCNDFTERQPLYHVETDRSVLDRRDRHAVQPPCR